MTLRPSSTTSTGTCLWTSAAVDASKPLVDATIAASVSVDKLRKAAAAGRARALELSGLVTDELLWTTF
jgi:hypothetical protein